MKLLVLLLSTWSACAAVNVHNVLTWQNVARGTVSNPTSLNAGTAGTNDGWTSGSVTRFSMIASVTNGAFPVTVTCSNITYDGTGTNWLKNDENTGGAENDMFFKFNSAVTPLNDVAIAGFIQFNLTNNTGNYVDVLEMTQANGQRWSIIHVTPTATTVGVQAHSQRNDGSSSVGNSLTLTQGYVYYYVLYARRSVLTNYVRIYDPQANYSLVGESQSDIGSNADLFEVMFISGYSANVTNNVVYGQTVVLYNATEAQLTSLVTPTTTPITSRSGTGRAIGRRIR